jgi:hypothetical protein
MCKEKTHQWVHENKNHAHSTQKELVIGLPHCGESSLALEYGNWKNEEDHNFSVKIIQPLENQSRS